MGRMPWDTQEPGHFETALVQHGGESAAGAYGSTLPLIDVATGWSERVMLLGRGQQAMERAFNQVFERLPFASKERHPDHGTEFFNAHLVRRWKEKVTGVTLSRSRPYQKTANRYVEQKNATLVRQYCGALRLDTPEQIAAGNALYERMWLYYNLFQPVLHLHENVVAGAQVRRKWDQAQTPYQRLLATGVLSQEQQARVQVLYEHTKPLRLPEEISAGLAAIWETAVGQNGTAA
jgi:hypothetical protein